ncbi:hypothetical protein FRC01_002024 [Tulasnella sp. 417]|nr:hypothetical protein FRC01_002024 [Tulasnella sp. 417]
MALEKLVTRKKPPYELKFHIDEVGPPTPQKASTSSGKRHVEQPGTEHVGSSERDGNSECDGGSPPAKKRKLIRGSTLGSDMERARSEEDSLPAGGGDLEPEADKLKKKKKKKDKAREKDSARCAKRSKALRARKALRRAVREYL